MIQLLTLPLLAILGYQDFKTLSVNQILIIALVVIQFFIGLVQSENGQTYCLTSILNIALIAFQLILVTIYFKIKANVKLKNTILGTGDLFFFLFLCFAYSPLNLITFLLISFIVTLIIHLLIKGKNEKIPLIGYLAIYCGIVFVIGINTHDDTFVSNMLSQFVEL